jgi:hypothetical protein
MAKLDVFKSFLVPPDMQAVVTGLEIVKQMRRFVDDDVTVRVFGFVGGPAHMREAGGDAVTFQLDPLWFEPVVGETSPRIRHPVVSPQRSRSTTPSPGLRRPPEDSAQMSLR